jgi:hypothetical protein
LGADLTHEYVSENADTAADADAWDVTDFGARGCVRSRG